jgi:hypothetical protein
MPAAVASAARKRPRQTTLAECADLLIAKLPPGQLPLSPTPHFHNDGDDDNSDDGSHPLCTADFRKHQQSPDGRPSRLR